MSNPILNSKFSNDFNTFDTQEGVMSIQGTAIKTFILLAITVLSASYTFMQFIQGFTDKVNILTTAGVMGGLIAAFVAIFNVRNKAVLIPAVIIYAIFEGLLLGGISGFYAVITKGSTIIVNAVCATFATMFAMLILYSTRIIKCGEKFRSTVFIATFAVFVIYAVNFIVSLFNPNATSLLMGSGPVGIGFSFIVCLIAAFNFIVDFHIIEEGQNKEMPKYFEWYGAFGLMVTLIWLYLEVLRLFAKISDNN